MEVRNCWTCTKKSFISFGTFSICPIWPNFLAFIITWLSIFGGVSSSRLPGYILCEVCWLFPFQFSLHVRGVDRFRSQPVSYSCFVFFFSLWRKINLSQFRLVFASLTNSKDVQFLAVRILYLYTCNRIGLPTSETFITLWFCPMFSVPMRKTVSRFR